MARREMQSKYVVKDAKTNREIKRFDLEHEAHAFVENGPPKDMLGDVEWYILKIWTNKQEKT